MRALLRLHTAIVGRIPFQASCQALGGLLPRQNRHFIRGNVRWCSTEAEGSDNKKHKADLVLHARFEPASYLVGCDKDDYRRYFKRGKVYVLGEAMKDRSRTITEMIRGLRPDAVVMMPLDPDATEAMDRSPEKAAQVLSEEILVAYKEAKALPHCDVVCDDLSLGMSPIEMAKVHFSSRRMDADHDMRLKELRERISGAKSEREKKEFGAQYQRLTFAANPQLRELMLDRELYATYVLQRTVNEQASEKYKRLQASAEDNLEPVRIVTLTDFDDLEGIEKNWQRPIEKERVDELFKKKRSSGGLVIAINVRTIRWIVAGIAVLIVTMLICVTIGLQKLVWGLAGTLMKIGGRPE